MMQESSLCGLLTRGSVSKPLKRGGSLAGAHLQGGFTLVELAITITILAIVMAIAVGNIDMSRSRVLNDAREFKSSLGYARSESLNRARTVVMCASATAMDDASLTCAGSWHQGWLVFVDADGDGSPSSSEVLRRHAALSNTVTVTPSPAVSRIEFSFRGFSDNAAAFQFCSSAQPKAGRTLSLASSGRAMKQPGTADCS